MSVNYYSQQPPGWPGESGPAAQLHALQAPGRRAGVLQIVLGALALLMGGCFAIFAMPSFASQIASQPDVRIPDTSAAGLTPVEFIHLFCSIMAGIFIVVAVAFLVLGPFVRSSRPWAIVLSLIVTAVIEIFLLFSMVVGLVGGDQNGTSRLEGLVVSIPVVGAISLLILWLIQAWLSLKSIAAATAQWQQQYWQYQQAYAAHNPAAYGPGVYGPAGYGAQVPPQDGSQLPPQFPPAPPVPPPPPGIGPPPDFGPPPPQ